MTRPPRAALLLLVALAATCAWGAVEAQNARGRSAAGPAKLTAATLFQLDKVWTVRLTFTPDADKALTPVPSHPELARTDGFLGPEGKRNGLSGLRGLDFAYVHASFDLDTQHFADVAVRYKGNGTYWAGRDTGKFSFKIDFNKYVKGQQLAGLTRLNLHTNITDASFMNEVLAYRLYRDGGVPAPRTAYARVYISVPGVRANEYAGLYSLVEDVDARFAEDRFGVSGGAIYKPVTQRPFSDLGHDWARYNQTYDPKTALTPADEQRIIDFCGFVTRADDQTFAARLGEYVDLEAFARYMAVLVWIANPDSILQQGQNYYVYVHPRTHLMYFVPWDQDHSFGQFLWSPDVQQQRLDILHPWTMTNRFLQRVFAVPAFRTKYLAALTELTRTVTLPGRLWAQVDALAPVLSPVIAQEPTRARVALFAKAVAGETFTRPYYGGTAAPLKPFVRIRQASVLTQLQALH